ncbi:MAG: MerC domain-containing protein [Ferruginibacter sp.]|nr:MerC domain-containing protein [Ferruginibacter sp.]
MKFKLNWDALGAITSIVCAIHCAFLPVVLSSLPVFGVEIIHNVYFEWGMIFLAFAVGAYSLLHGFIKHHQSYTPLLVFCAGMLFLILKQFIPSYEYWFLAAAVSLILYAHYTNYKLCHKSKCNSPHHKH